MMPHDTQIDTHGPILKDYLRGDSELAHALGKSPRTVARWRALGDGPAVTKMGREVLYRIDDVERWLRACRNSDAT